MEALLLVSSLVRLLGVALQNPALEAGSDVVKYASALAAAAAAGRLTLEQLQVQVGALEAMIADNRPPTEDELAALKALSDDAHARIQAD